MAADLDITLRDLIVDPALRPETPPLRPPRLGSEGKRSTEPFGNRPVSKAPIELVGSTIGERYKVEAPLGAGGMGQVFRVRHLRLDKPFALKVIHAELSDSDDARRRFDEEARFVSSLAHPHIVCVVDYGEDPDVGRYMVMELLEGETLSEVLLRDVRLPQARFCDVLHQVAEAIHYIHGRGLIHGDIKPENVFLCAEDESQRRRRVSKLLDFGLATRAVQVGAGPGSIDGTPAYMAPERLRGGPPTAAVDIYSLGVFAYQLYTGALPFDGSLEDIAHGHMHETPLPLTVRIGAPVEERLEALVARALAKRPEDRHPDMAAFLYELRVLMEMLGLKRRRRVPSQEAPGGRTRQAAACFEVARVPLAGVRFDGVVIVANPAFSRFVSGKRDTSVEGECLFEGPLAATFPEFAAYLRAAHVEGRNVRGAVTLVRPTGETVPLTFWFSPAKGKEEGDVVVAVFY